MNTRILPDFKTLLLAATLGWAYFPTVVDLVDKWWNDPQYSHGFLVPLFSLWLLYHNRDRSNAEPKPMPWLGYGVLLAALTCRAIAALLVFTPLDAFSLIMCLTAVSLIRGGLPALRWTWQSLVFLVFMIPLPYQAERMMGAELQGIATVCTTFLLQAFGQPAIAEGNRILIEEVPLNVVEACSGLRMLMTFIAICAAAVMLIDRHWVVKALVLASAAPIALVTNILRITATGLAGVWLKNDSMKVEVFKFIHDFYGWMMPVVGLAFLLLELWIYRHLLIEPERA